MKVKDFEEGMRVTEKLMISSLTTGVTNAGAPYLNLTVQDNTKSIEAKLWDVKPELQKSLVSGKVYEFDLEIHRYKNVLQAKVLKVMPVPQSEVDPGDFSFRSPVPENELRNTLQMGLNSIENKNILKILNYILGMYQKEFYEYPAASKIHHNFIGGLATHTSGMLKLAFAINDLYKDINRDYLIAGVILHDIGKITELSSPVLTEYTTEGKLLGHISIMDAILHESAVKLNLEGSEEETILRHMILSHHGEYEYGSPVKPMTKEALILTYIDNIDAKLNIIDKALEEVAPGEFSQKIFSLDNTTFYKYKENK